MSRFGKLSPETEAKCEALGRQAATNPAGLGLRSEARRIACTSEAGFTREVIGCAQAHGWKAAHFRPGLTKSGRWVTAVQGDGKGFLDLVLVRERVAWVELKIPPNTLTPEQEQWVGWLRAAGQEVHMWVPADWPVIENVLA